MMNYVPANRGRLPEHSAKQLLIALLHHVQQWHVGIKCKVMMMFILLAYGSEVTDFAGVGDTLVLFQQFLAATLAHLLRSFMD
ncbi:hypothetical protein [Shewanella dokdonensis]|uniref:hypothetical protein n=1 Tax=Shewanella dokdonensis TaxID=712036 RepID=UPI00200D32E4|nr:hypothetical protein [Shewanella dokdonensis]MCL1073589.1 hypothetical protein [Shewanella dokdonensis]